MYIPSDGTFGYILWRFDEYYYDNCSSMPQIFNYQQLHTIFSGIKREEQKVTNSLKDAAKKGHMDVCKVLAKEVVNSRKAQNKLHAAKAHMNSVQMQMKNQLCMLRRNILLLKL